MVLLDARSLLRLAVTNRRFCALAKAESIWKAMFFRDLSLPAINIVPDFSWRSLYKAALGTNADLLTSSYLVCRWKSFSALLFTSRPPVPASVGVTDLRKFYGNDWFWDHSCSDGSQSYSFHQAEAHIGASPHWSTEIYCKRNKHQNTFYSVSLQILFW